MGWNPAVSESTGPDDLGERGMSNGPVKRCRCLNLDEVDACRRLDCDQYDACLALVVIQGWPGWECPSMCQSYVATTLEILAASPAQALVCLRTITVVSLS
jgi:hypothetical protein